MDSAIRDKYKVVIGLEVHAQLLTESKVFCADSTEYGALPNTNISVITLAHPGSMPKLNQSAVDKALMMGLACGSEITRYNIFDRKNYFYPDLPKGYQITQDKTPVCMGGSITINKEDGTEKDIGLTRVHMEEDAGKSIHMEGDPDTIVDFNRAGVPLIEIVTQPEIESSEEAYAFLTEIRKLVRYLEICDGNMEEGSMRCDANISVMLQDATEFGKKVEVKNMNSIRNVQRAIEHEIERQILLVEAGKEIISETRNFDAPSGKTTGMRTKEELNDYRYFPEPDLSPMVISDEWLDSIRAKMPPLPRELYNRFIEAYNLPVYDAQVLTDNKDVALYFEALCKHTKNYKAASNWVMGPVKSYLNELTLHVHDFPIKPEKIAAMISLVDNGSVSFSAASQKLFPALAGKPEADPLKLAEELDLIHESDHDSILPMIEEVLASYPDKVAAYRNGKKGLLGMFMGEIMKKSRGKADPKVTNQLLRAALENEN